MWEYSYCCLKGNKPDHDVCQDYCFEEHDDGIECIVVCDGASSGINSEIGAEFVSKYIAKYFINHFDVLWNGSLSEHNSLIYDLHQNLIMKLSDYVVSHGRNPIVLDDRTISSEELYKYCTTVQLLAICGNKAIAYKIGNGSMAYIDGNILRLLFKSTHDTFTAHITYKRTIDTLMNSQLCRFNISESINGFMLMSDGVDFEGGLFYADELTENAITLLNEVIQCPQHAQNTLEHFIAQMSTDKTNVPQDDISVSLLLRNGSASPITQIENEQYNFASTIGNLGGEKEVSNGLLQSDLEALLESKLSLFKPSVSLIPELQSRIEELESNLEKQESKISEINNRVDKISSDQGIQEEKAGKNRLKSIRIAIILSSISIIMAIIGICLGVFYQ